MDVVEEGVAVEQQRVHRVRSRGAGRVWDQSRWSMAVHDLEWCGAKSGVEHCVVAVLRPWQPVKPRSGSITGRAAKVHGYRLVRRLGLPVGLGVERRAHLQLDARELEQVPPDMAGEHRVAVADDGLREAV